MYQVSKTGSKTGVAETLLSDELATIQVILAGTLTGYKVTLDTKFWRPFPL